jgi:hypothetical protein
VTVNISATYDGVTQVIPLQIIKWVPEFELSVDNPTILGEMTVIVMLTFIAKRWLVALLSA